MSRSSARSGRSRFRANSIRACIAPILLVLTALTSCVSGTSAEREHSYEVTGPVTTLVINAQAGSVAVEAGEGPITVTETYRFTRDQPRTSHELEGTTLRLEDAGCAEFDPRCHVEFNVRAPAATAVDVRTRAGAIRIAGLDGDIELTNEAGTVEAAGLASKRVSSSTRTGSITLSFSKPPNDVKASAAFGSVEVMVPTSTAYAVEVSTKLGGSEILVPRDAASPHKISLRTELGGLRVASS